MENNGRVTPGNICLMTQRHFTREISCMKHLHFDSLSSGEHEITKSFK